MGDFVQKFLSTQEKLAERAKRMASPEIQQKLKDYDYWSEQLPILRRELEEIMGERLGESPPVQEAEKSSRGRKKGSQSVPESEIEEKMREALKQSPGIPASEIARNIQMANWPSAPETTIYAKVNQILKKDEGRSIESKKYRKEGEKRNTRWFLIST